MKRASDKSITIEQQRKVNMKNLDHSNMGVVAIVPEVAVSTVSTIIVFYLLTLFVLTLLHLLLSKSLNGLLFRKRMKN